MNIRTSNFDAIAAAAPLDAKASVVRDGSGDHYEVELPVGVMHFKAPPLPDERFVAPASAARDLIGRVIGRLTVLRLHGMSGPSRNARALCLVRCSCGDYELRRAERLRKNTDPDACCFICERVKQLRARASQPSTGRTREASARLLDQIARPERPGLAVRKLQVVR